MPRTAVVEKEMTPDDRIVKLESDVTHLRSDVGELKTDVRELRGEVNSLRAEFHTFKAEVAKELGLLRTAIVQAKLWMLVTGISTIIGVAAVVGLKMH